MNKNTRPSQYNQYINPTLLLCEYKDLFVHWSSTTTGTSKKESPNQDLNHWPFLPLG